MTERADLRPNAVEITVMHGNRIVLPYYIYDDSTGIEVPVDLSSFDLIGKCLAVGSSGVPEDLVFDRTDDAGGVGEVTFPELAVGSYFFEMGFAASGDLPTTFDRGTLIVCKGLL